MQIVFLNAKPKVKTPDWIKNKIEKAKEAQKAVPEQADFLEYINKNK